MRKKCLPFNLALILVLAFALAGCSGNNNNNTGGTTIYPTIYTATTGGLSISKDGGTTFTNYTKETNGLGSNFVAAVYVDP
ncbi:MAG TPA: hypothetical protein VF531_00255 [Bacillota bacterium]